MFLECKKNKPRITILVENTVGVSKKLIGERGLSILIETPDIKILFDTGAKGNLLLNAIAMGVDLKSINFLVMSHGHYDHSGGMQAFLRFRSAIPVYARPDFFSLHYANSPEKRYIGVPFRIEELESLGAQFIFTRKPKQIAPNIWISGEIPRNTEFERVDNHLICLKDNAEFVPDPLYDDMSLYLSTPEGLVIISGCAHAGLVNTIKHAQKITGIKDIYGIIGGTHLGPASAFQLEATIDFFKSLNLKLLAANHCAGFEVMSKLYNVFSSKFHFAPAATTFSLPL